MAGLTRKERDMTAKTFWVDKVHKVYRGEWARDKGIQEMEEEGWEVDVIEKTKVSGLFGACMVLIGDDPTEYRITFKKHWEGGEKKGLHWDMPLRQSD